jgi:hypothetical protein
LRALTGKVLDLEKLLGRKTNQIKKCLATLRTKKAKLGEMEGEASIYEALVETLMDDDA